MARNRTSEVGRARLQAAPCTRQDVMGERCANTPRSAAGRLGLRGDYQKCQVRPLPNTMQASAASILACGALQKHSWTTCKRAALMQGWLNQAAVLPLLAPPHAGARVAPGLRRRRRPSPAACGRRRVRRWRRGDDGGVVHMRACRECSPKWGPRAEAAPTHVWGMPPRFDSCQRQLQMQALTTARFAACLCRAPPAGGPWRWQPSGPRKVGRWGGSWCCRGAAYRVPASAGARCRQVGAGFRGIGCGHRVGKLPWETRPMVWGGWPRAGPSPAKPKTETR